MMNFFTRTTEQKMEFIFHRNSPCRDGRELANWKLDPSFFGIKTRR